MKSKFIIAFSIAGLFSTAFTNHEGPNENYKINQENSTVEWIGKKVAGAHSGNIKISTGEIQINHGEPIGGHISIDMNSMICTDMKGEYGDKLVGHLKNDDFFSTDKFPMADLAISKIEKIAGVKKDGEPNYTITGNLTIKGISNSINFPAYILLKDNSVAAIGEISIDRTLYNIKYGSASFIENIGDKAIDNHFILKFKLAAKKS